MNNTPNSPDFHNDSDWNSSISPSFSEPNSGDEEKVLEGELLTGSHGDVHRARSGRPVVRQRKWLTLILFLATCVTTFLAGLSSGPIPAGLDEEAVWQVAISNGVTYAGCLMLILLFHEMGHYLQAVRYHVPASYPYFIPFPGSPFGTMGAVIVQGAHVADRKQMFDIAISGPLAGLIIAMPVACFGVQQSETMVLDDAADGIQLIFGDPLLLQWMYTLKHGPLPEDTVVINNPLLFAGWVGIFITALNLIPLGQLDGGHILYTLIGRKSYIINGLIVLCGVLAMMWFREFSYMFLLILIILMGPFHPPTANDHVPLGIGRALLGWVTLGFMLIGFTPTPLTVIEPEEQPDQQQPPAAAIQIENDLPQVTVRIIASHI